MTQTTFTIGTLGCKVNHADSEAIAAALIDKGMVPAQAGTQADVVVVNTCTVTHLGDRSSRQMISQERRLSPNALVVATGCYAQVSPQAVAALHGVDVVVTNTEKDSLANTIVERLGNFSPQSTKIDRALSLPMLDNTISVADNPDRQLALIMGRTRSQVKVQDGCDNRCTYCIVPTARGASRSRTIADVVAYAQRKEAAGIQEIVLTGVHLGDYHPTEQEDLGTLLTALLHETGIPRIRVSSLEPEDFKLDWLELWQNPRLCRHLHLPLQSGSDTILRKMARHYLADRYRTIATTAQDAIPGLALTTDIIVGFPGETDEDAARTYELAQELAFSKMHVFRFSARAGTAAARMRGTVPETIKRQRSEQLLTLNAQLQQAFRARHLHQSVQVLWEGQRSWGWEGLTDNYLRVELTGDAIPPQRDLHHTITWATVTAITPEGVAGYVQ